jgi:nicotinamide-nucleotide amidase
MSMIPDSLVAQAQALVEALIRNGRMIATAESCTGGLIAAVITEVPGSSAALERGFVTYSNEAKTQLLDVPAALIARHGAVSEEVARAMATGAIIHSRADLAVAVTGIAGPGGGSPEKPVGLVHLAAAARDGRVRHEACRFGDLGRRGIRVATVERALALAGRLLP